MPPNVPPDAAPPKSRHENSQVTDLCAKFKQYHPSVTPWLDPQHQKRAPTEVLSRLPGYEASYMFSKTTCHKPTAEILEHAMIVFRYPANKPIQGESSQSIHRRIRPAQPKFEYEKYLPPYGEYFDAATMCELDLNVAACKRKGCVSCWSPAHERHPCQCTRKCKVCKNVSHKGSVCPKIYASARWWNDTHEYDVHDKNLRIRPSAPELVYLILAGVFIYRPGMHIREPLVVNYSHPAVSIFYHHKNKPAPILPQQMRQSEQHTRDCHRKLLPMPVPGSALGVTANAKKSVDRPVAASSSLVQVPDAPQAHPSTDKTTEASTLPVVTGDGQMAGAKTASAIVEDPKAPTELIGKAGQHMSTSQGTHDSVPPAPAKHAGEPSKRLARKVISEAIDDRANKRRRLETEAEEQISKIRSEMESKLAEIDEEIALLKEALEE